VMVALITPAAIKTGPWQFLWFAWVFPLGMAAALVRRPTRWLLPAGVAVLVAGLALADLPMAVAGVLLVLGIRDVPVPRWLATAGTRLSYPVYLWHVTVFALIANFWAGVAVTLAVSAASWILVERPSQASTFGRRRKVAIATTAPPLTPG